MESLSANLDNLTESKREQLTSLIKKSQMNTLNINVENLTLEERKQAFDLFEKSQTKKPLRFEPKKYQSYYSVLEAGDIEESQWDNDYIDENRAQHGNVFRKKKTAEQAANKHRSVNKIVAFVEELDGFGGEHILLYNSLEEVWDVIPVVPDTLSLSPLDVLMTAPCARALANALNSGEYEL